MDVCLFARPDLAPGGTVPAFLDVVRAADAAGLHSVCFGEHIVMAPDTTRYPYGPWGHAPDTAWLDPLTVLAAVAAVTTRIRLSTAVLLAPLRAGLVLAKTIATLDVVSAGRVELGVGTGWQAEEYVGVGLSWSDRQRRFDEVIEQCRTAWGEQPFDVTVDGVRLEALTAWPRPVQARIPLLYGVQASAANVARIARLGDGWTPVGVGPDQVREGVAALRAAFEDAGRDPQSLVVRVALPPVLDDRGRIDVERTFAPAPAYVDAGASMFVVGFNHRLTSPAEGDDLVAGYAAAGQAL
ncbi:MAG TPA: TIGR03619 family F420-dependent LLM class oxidoreductase [Mycobacteriales bacterium]|nr:TIGR03619 family F420-dependent LLM class oxidoreductase [Mycobacteriales bacterium]